MLKSWVVLALPAAVLACVGCQRDIRYEPPPPVTAEAITDIKDAWVRLYDKDGFGGRTLTIRYPQDHPSFRHVRADNGVGNFNDSTASAKWQIPAGWQFVLYDDFDYTDNRFPLLGTGKVESHAGPIAGHSSSGRWERKP